MASMNNIIRKIKKLYHKIRFGEITSEIVATSGDNVPSEIVYYDRNKNAIGYWAYGYWHPRFPYKGD